MNTLINFLEDYTFNLINMLGFNLPRMLIEFNSSYFYEQNKETKVLVFEPYYIPQDDNISQFRKLFRCFNNIINNLFDFFNSFRKESSQDSSSSPTNNKTYSSSAENEIPKSETSKTNYYGNGEDASSSPEKGNYYGNGEDTSSSTEKGNYYGNGEGDAPSSPSLISELVEVNSFSINKEEDEGGIPPSSSSLELLSTTSNEVNELLGKKEQKKQEKMIKYFVWNCDEINCLKERIKIIKIPPLTVTSRVCNQYFCALSEIFSGTDVDDFYTKLYNDVYNKGVLEIALNELTYKINTYKIYNNSMNENIVIHRTNFINYFKDNNIFLLDTLPDCHINKEVINKIIDLMFDNYKYHFEYFYENIFQNNKDLFETQVNLDALKTTLILDLISKYTNLSMTEYNEYFFKTSEDYMNGSGSEEEEEEYNNDLYNIIFRRQNLFLIANYMPNSCFNIDVITKYFYEFSHLEKKPYKINIKDLVSRNKHIVPFYDSNFLMLAEVKYINNLKIQIN